MKIVTAAASGMCFGVRDALVALAAIKEPRSVAIYGELVHNDVVLHQLDVRGFQQIAETDREELPEASQVVVTAHGISQRRRQQFIDAGKTLIDTTCPLVARVHRAAQELAQSGAFIVVIGRSGHVEIEGIVGDLDSYAIVASIADVECYSARRIGVICQTTFPCEEADAIRVRIAECNPQAKIQWVDTICQPTKDRQQALNELCEQVEAVVVIGGRHSHNTLRLVDSCRKRGRAVFHVQDASELEPKSFERFETVGVTAGTSTLPETIEQVVERLQAIADLLVKCKADELHSMPETTRLAS